MARRLLNMDRADGYAYANVVTGTPQGVATSGNSTRREPEMRKQTLWNCVPWLVAAALLAGGWGKCLAADTKPADPPAKAEEPDDEPAAEDTRSRPAAGRRREGPEAARSRACPSGSIRSRSRW